MFLNTHEFFHTSGSVTLTSEQHKCKLMLLFYVFYFTVPDPTKSNSSPLHLITGI